MKENGFQVCCPSCETLFVVTDPELVGQIVACPKCGGMMMIEPATEGGCDAAAPKTRSDADAAVPSENSAADNAPAPVQEVWPHSASRAPHETEEPRGQVSVSSPADVHSGGQSPDEDTAIDVPRAAASRLPFIVSGVLCALAAALVFGFVKAYRSTDVETDLPVVQTAERFESTDALPGSDESGDAEVVSDGADDSENDSIDVVTAENDDSELNAESSILTDDDELSGVDSTDSTPLNGADVENVVSTRGDSDHGSEVADVVENADGEQTDSLDADETIELYSDENNGVLAVDELDIVIDDNQESDLAATDSGDESLTEEDAIPTEFDEAEFEKENQVQEEEKSESDEEDLGAIASTTDVSIQNLPVLKSEPREIDVDARLALPIRSLVFPESPAAGVRLLSEFAGVPVEMDLERFVLMRPSLNMRLDLKVENVNVAGALDKEAEMLKWNVRKEDDRVILEPLENDLSTVLEERFDVADLVNSGTPFLKEVAAVGSSSSSTDDSSEEDAGNGDDVAALLVRFIVSLVDPEKWTLGRESDAASEISIDDSELIVTSDAATRKKVEIALEQLRVLRQLEPRADMAPELLVPESRGWETLSRTTPFNLLKPTSLQQAMEILEGKFKFLILWDDATLNLFGVGRDSSTAARIESASVNQIIDALLEPLKLTYVILDEKLVLITTKERADSYKTIEIHGFSSVDAPKSLEEALRITEEMKSAVAPDSWNNSDASIWLDVETGCWVIRQSQPIQREIRRWTNELLEKERARNKKKTGNSARPTLNDRAPEVASRPKE